MDLVDLSASLLIFLFLDYIYQKIPETSYFKLIDYWFLFSLSFMALSMGFHTGLAFYLRKKRNSGQTSEKGYCACSKNKVVPLAFQEKKAEAAAAGGRGSLATDLKTAEAINSVGLAVFVVLFATFNTWFWVRGFQANQLEEEEERALRNFQC